MAHWRTVVWQLAGLGWAVSSLAAGAAEIVLERSAVEAAVKQSLFADQGRFYLLRGKCYAYLETPSVALKNGELAIRTHLSSRLGVEVSGQCLGPGFASWLTVRGQPVGKDGVIQLQNVRVDEVQSEATRTLLASQLMPALPRAIELDVLQAVRKMLEGNRQGWQATVDTLTFNSVSAADDKLRVVFDFRLTAR